MQHQGNNEKLESPLTITPTNRDLDDFQSWKDSIYGEDIGGDVVDRRNPPPPRIRARELRRKNGKVRAVLVPGQVGDGSPLDLGAG